MPLGYITCILFRKLVTICKGDLMVLLDFVLESSLCLREVERVLCRIWSRRFITLLRVFSRNIGNKVILKRAHNIAMIWRKAAESHPRLPSPVDCGWEFDATRHHYAPVRILQPMQP